MAIEHREKCSDRQKADPSVARGSSAGALDRIPLPRDDSRGHQAPGLFYGVALRAGGDVRLGPRSLAPQHAQEQRVLGTPRLPTNNGGTT